MNTDTIVPYVPVSEERKLQLEIILREGNVLLKKYHEEMKILLNIAKHNRTSFLNSIAKNYIPGEDLDFEGIIIPHEDAEKIVLVKKIEGEVICAYANLINKLAQRWKKQESDISLSVEDLKSEAYHAALAAIAHFTKEVRFSTFLHHCIQRHMSRLCRTSNGLSSFSDGAVKLKSEYARLSKEEGATFDSITQKMNISEKEIRILQICLSSIQNMTSLEKEDKSKIVIIDDCKEPEKENKILDIIKKIEFSELEKAVLDGVISSPNTKLGLGCVSKKLINPNTNKPYSRMAFSLAWKRIKKKINDAYKNVA
jgi:DNA-directed RNA polymerase specialized sigma subunit